MAGIHLSLACFQKRAAIKTLFDVVRFRGSGSEAESSLGRVVSRSLTETGLRVFQVVFHLRQTSSHLQNPPSDLSSVSLIPALNTLLSDLLCSYLQTNHLIVLKQTQTPNPLRCRHHFSGNSGLGCVEEGELKALHA